MPRRWGGTYLAYGTAGASQAVKLDLASVTPVGQMIVLRGTMTIGSVSTPVQGNLNAKSDQLDLLVLGDANAAGLELGGQFRQIETADREKNSEVGETAGEEHGIGWSTPIAYGGEQHHHRRITENQHAFDTGLDHR